MRRAKIIYKGEEAGVLTQDDNGFFTYTYNDLWMADNGKPSISLALPKTSQEYHADYLFPFFFNMLPEGSNKQVVCRLMRIDEYDYFGLLLTTAKYDTLGAVTVIKIQEPV
ncbi:MAG: phosphatidylinositol kinase [Mariniphaga sp.]|nr:phosphatidylinositol kinase [Mariniphaga sp.]